jgi:hypothetical protein
MAEDKDKPKGLTIEQLRTLKNYENISDEQAQETVFAIKNLAALFYEHLKKKKIEKESKDDEIINEQQQVINVENKSAKKGTKKSK